MPPCLREDGKGIPVYVPHAGKGRQREGVLPLALGLGGHRAMASSWVAAMPHDSTPWRDPPRTSSRPGGFFNILVPPPPPSPHHPRFPDHDAGAAAAGAGEPTPRRRRQILDRWAAAAGAPAPLEQRRRAREAELSALASAARPVAARAAMFREPSPPPSDASSTEAGGGGGAELPPAGPRASSLIQRWREIEAVGPATPRPCDPASDSDGGSPRGRVGCIVKTFSGTSSLPDDELDAANKEVALSKSAPPSPAPMGAALEPHTAASINGPRPTQLVVRMVRGRRAMEELVAMMAHRRRCELAAVADRLVVSRFAHKGRIQSMLRLRLLRQGVKVKDEVWTLPRPVRPRLPEHEPEAYTTSKCIAGNQHKGGQVLAEKSTGSVERVVSSDGSGNEQYDGQNNTSENQCQEGCANMVKLCTQNQEYSEPSSFVRHDEHSTVDDVSPSTISTLHELCTPSSRGDNLREEDNQSLNGSWEERALWISSLGWPAPVEAMSPDSWNQDAVRDIENHTQIEFNDRPWIDSPNSWRSLCVATQANSRALSGNADICNLLESKKVSKSLESDFSNKMNNLLLTILHKQRQQHMINDFEGYCDERLYWRQNDEPQSADQRVSAQCSLAPVSHLAIHQQESWQRSSFEHQHHENQNFLEMEVRVRSEMAQVHHEIYELRKLVESCIASQVKIQHSIRYEVCSALREAGLIPSQPGTTAKRGSCCICHETQADSLLYRCGHMCTCFNCADQLKSSNRSCPICQSPIEDVVRAHMNF